MLTRGRELFWALVAILAITASYTLVVKSLGALPAAQSFFGHALGTLGFLLMLITETLYSLRKRSRRARWGKMSSWLEFHIFTGIVGPYMVLLHTSWKFNGLAGVVFLLTVMIVLSGFIGRYIYTAIPRTVDGGEVQAREIGAHIRRVEEALERQAATQAPAARVLAERLASLPPVQSSSPASVLGRAFTEMSFRLEWWREQRQMDAATRSRARALKQLIDQRRALRRQLESIAAARRLLSIWHAVHIPLGLALFTSAFVHIAGAIYYATLLH